MNNFDNKEVGKRLKELRVGAHYTQEQLAEKLNFGSKSSIAKIENGSASIDLDRLIQLSELFGCSVDYILKGKTGDNIFYSYFTPEVIKEIENDNDKVRRHINIFFQKAYSLDRFEHPIMRALMSVDIELGHLRSLRNKLTNIIQEGKNELK